MQAKAKAQHTADADEERRVGAVIVESPSPKSDPAVIAKQLAIIQRDLAALDSVLAKIDRVKEAGETAPTHIPLTDPQARVTPN